MQQKTDIFTSAIAQITFNDAKFPFNNKYEFFTYSNEIWRIISMYLVFPAMVTYLSARFAAQNHAILLYF